MNLESIKEQRNIINTFIDSDKQVKNLYSVYEFRYIKNGKLVNLYEAEELDCKVEYCYYSVMDIRETVELLRKNYKDFLKENTIVICLSLGFERETNEHYEYSDPDEEIEYGIEITNRQYIPLYVLDKDGLCCKPLTDINIQERLEGEY